MIITRSPLRISLGGGGTDLPSYYEKHTGFLIAAAIDKYVCITLHHTFVPELIIKYSKLERVSSVEEIQHPIVREALMLVGVDGSGLEITSMADIPAGTGLGSSGSFTTALLKALHTHKKNLMHPQRPGRASLPHRDRTSPRADRQAGPVHRRLRRPDVLSVSAQRPGRGVAAADQLRNALQPRRQLVAVLHRLQPLGVEHSQGAGRQEQANAIRAWWIICTSSRSWATRARRALEIGDLVRFAELMNVHWEHKKQRSGGMSNSEIDQWYQLARANGALGGKLIGAGGGGFLMFYAEDKTRLRRAMARDETARGAVPLRF